MRAVNGNRKLPKSSIIPENILHCTDVNLCCLRFYSCRTYHEVRKEASAMLSENIKTLRKSKGLSQEELAVKLNVVRQTISKWEQGLSVPDAEMLVALSEALETPVSTMLSEKITEPEADDLKAIAEKLEVINLQLSKKQQARRKTAHWLFISSAIVIILLSAILFDLKSPYSGWNYSDPETAVLGTAFHSFEWLFVRIAPILLIGSIIGIIMTRRKDR